MLAPITIEVDDELTLNPLPEISHDTLHSAHQSLKLFWMLFEQRLLNDPVPAIVVTIGLVVEHADI